MGKRKASRKTLIKKLDKIVSEYIRDRDQKCVQCGKVDTLTNGHVFSRRHYSLRWDIRPDGNCHCQCWGCNYKHSYDNYDYYLWFQNKFGKDKFESMRFEYKKSKKFTNVELENLYEIIKAKKREIG